VAVHGIDSLETAAIHLRRAVALLAAGEIEDARADAARAIELFAPLGDGHPELERARALVLATRP